MAFTERVTMQILKGMPLKVTFKKQYRMTHSIDVLTLQMSPEYLIFPSKDNTSKKNAAPEILMISLG